MVTSIKFDTISEGRKFEIILRTYKFKLNIGRNEIKYHQYIRIDM